MTHRQTSSQRSIPGLTTSSRPPGLHLSGATPPPVRHVDDLNPGPPRYAQVELFIDREARMSEGLDVIQSAIENEPRDTEKTRRQFVSRAAVALGGMGIVGALPASAFASSSSAMAGNDTQTILNVAATAEVLATIVNTVGYRQEIPNDDVTLRNIGAAAQEELRHYDVLVSLGAV